MEHLSDNKLKEVKRSFRSMMNGVTAQSMRTKGVNYHLNWGVRLPQLRQMASEYGKDEQLAMALWKENIRECKILATMIMPEEKMLDDMVTLWMEQMPTQEIAEIAVLNLFQKLPDAPHFAFAWIARSEPLYQIAGYGLMARLFVRGNELSEMGINEYLDQVEAALSDDNVAVRRAAFNSLNKFCELGEEYSMLARKAVTLTDDFI